MTDIEQRTLENKRDYWYEKYLKMSLSHHGECCYCNPVSAAGAPDGSPLSHLACCMCRSRRKKRLSE